MFTKVTIVIALAILATAYAKPKAEKVRAPKPKELKRYASSLIDTRVADSICSAKEFNCSAYTCINLHEVCDTIDQCVDGSDEKQNCPTDCSGKNQFKCVSDSKCIPQSSHCNGIPDCVDWSDEADCAEFDCLEGFTHCVRTLECIKESYRCDGDLDCEDGSDEAGCPNNPASCITDQFHCKSGSTACISNDYVCDGERDCTDGSDEAGCTCKSNEFKCTNGGGCIPKEWKCDGDTDCGDSSDEYSCGGAAPHQCYDVMTAVDCVSMNSTAHPICLIHADGHKFCRKFCGLCDANPSATMKPAGK